jgi:hypothetical protein
MSRSRLLGLGVEGMDDINRMTMLVSLSLRSLELKD